MNHPLPTPNAETLDAQASISLAVQHARQPGSGRPPPAFRRAAHYLQRIDRLNPAHAELALGLYRDQELLRHVLQELSLPADATRVAISLEDPEQGPFVIVTRHGDFVTCLGAGMRVRDDQPVVTRGRLEALSQKVQSVRALLAEIKTGDRRETQRMLRRLYTAGDQLTREQFNNAARWVPLMGHSFLLAYCKTIQANLEFFRCLSTIKRLSPKRHEELLEAYWRSTWAIGHYALLLGVQGAQNLKRLFGLDDVTAEESEDLATLLWLGPACTGVGAIALRGAWLMSRVAKPTLFALKRGYSTARGLDMTVAAGLGLAAIAQKHRRHRAEVGKVLARRYEHEGDPRLELMANARARLREACELDPTRVDALRAQAVELARDSLFTRERPAASKCFADRNDLPAGVALPLLLASSQGLIDQPDSTSRVTRQLPWAVQLEAEQFYVPESYRAALAGPFEPSWALALLAPRLSVYGPHAGPPIRVAPKPGRNELCTCGSGTKYKRCHGAVTRSRAA